MSVVPDELIRIPGGPFLLGARHEDLPTAIREADQKKALGLGAVLASTPPHWVDVPEFEVAAGMTSNGDYQKFWQFEHPEIAGSMLVDDVQIWEHVWAQFPLSSVRVPVGDAGGHAVEDYTACHTAIDAIVKSYSYECQRIFLEHHVPPGSTGFDDLSTTIIRAAGIKRALAHIIYPEETGLDRGEMQVLADGGDSAQIIADIEKLVNNLDLRFGVNGRDVPLLIVLRVPGGVARQSPEITGFSIAQTAVLA